jgi:hypothetical protein
MVKQMATTSLWNDELYSLMRFALRGPSVTVTDYHAPNNHVFFNLLNGPLASVDPRSPFWTRLLSITAVLTGTVLAAASLARRSWGEAAGFLALVTLNWKLLELNLTARGYGLCYFFAIALVLLVQRLLVSFSWRLAGGVVVVTAAGVYTVPSFFIVPLGLLSGAALVSRKVRFIAMGACGAIVAALAYSPMWAQMAGHARGYAKEWGSDFDSLGGLELLLGRYLLPTPGVGRGSLAIYLTILALTVGAAIYLHRLARPARRKPYSVLLIGFHSALACCFLLETPPVRTAAVLVPMAVLLIVEPAVDLLRRTVDLAGTRAGRRFGGKEWPGRIAVLLPLVIAMTLVQQRALAQSHRFVPYESWRAVASFIDTFVPGNVSVACNFRAHYLRHYTDRPIVAVSDAEVCSHSHRYDVFVESEKDKDNVSYEDLGCFGPVVDFPQRRGGRQRVYFRIPSESGLSMDASVRAETSALATDGDPNSRWTTKKFQEDMQDTVSVTFRASGRLCGLAAFCDNGDCPRAARVTAFDSGGEHVSAETVMHDSLMLVSFGDHSVEEVRVDAAPAAVRRYFSINEAWAIPCE